jgi:hypothetical protein
LEARRSRGKGAWGLGGLILSVACS